jgi:hypothetical protein
MQNISAKYWGLITATVMIASFLICFYILKLPETGTTQYILFSLYTAGILIALYNFSTKINEEEKGFKNYFSEGFKCFVIVVFFMSIFTYVFYKINPQIIASKLEEINKINSKDPNKTAAEVLANGEKLKSISTVMNVAIYTVMYLILGALITLIGSGFFSQFKQKK